MKKNFTTAVSGALLLLMSGTAFGLEAPSDCDFVSNMMSERKLLLNELGSLLRDFNDAPHAERDTKLKNLMICVRNLFGQNPAAKYGVPHFTTLSKEESDALETIYTVYASEFPFPLRLKLVAGLSDMMPTLEFSPESLTRLQEEALTHAVEGEAPFGREARSERRTGWSKRIEGEFIARMFFDLFEASHPMHELFPRLSATFNSYSRYDSALRAKPTKKEIEIFAKRHPWILEQNLKEKRAVVEAWVYAHFCKHNKKKKSEYIGFEDALGNTLRRHPGMPFWILEMIRMTSPNPVPESFQIHGGATMRYDVATRLCDEENITRLWNKKNITKLKMIEMIYYGFASDSGKPRGNDVSFTTTTPSNTTATPSEPTPFGQHVGIVMDFWGEKFRKILKSDEEFLNECYRNVVSEISKVLRPPMDRATSFPTASELSKENKKAYLRELVETFAWLTEVVGHVRECREVLMAVLANGSGGGRARILPRMPGADEEDLDTWKKKEQENVDVYYEALTEELARLEMGTTTTSSSLMSPPPPDLGSFFQKLVPMLPPPPDLGSLFQKRFPMLPPPFLMLPFDELCNGTLPKSYYRGVPKEWAENRRDLLTRSIRKGLNGLCALGRELEEEEEDRREELVNTCMELLRVPNVRDFAMADFEPFAPYNDTNGVIVGLSELAEHQMRLIGLTSLERELVELDWVNATLHEECATITAILEASRTSTTTSSTTSSSSSSSAPTLSEKDAERDEQNRKILANRLKGIAEQLATLNEVRTNLVKRIEEEKAG